MARKNNTRTNEFINRAYTQLNKTNAKLKRQGYNKSFSDNEFESLLNSKLTNNQILQSLTMSRKSPTISVFDRNILNKKIKNVQKMLNKEREFYNSLTPTRLGKRIKNTTLLRERSDVELRLNRIEDYINQDFDGMISNSKLNGIKYILDKFVETPNYQDYQKSGIELLEYAKLMSNANEEKANKVIEAIKNLTPDDYNKLYYSERILNKLIHAYNIFNSLEGEQDELKEYELEIATDFEDFYENLEYILKDEYSYALKD